MNPSDLAYWNDTMDLFKYGYQNGFSDGFNCCFLCFAIVLILFSIAGAVIFIFVRSKNK